ncbi:AAA-domain-containing protein, partial [Hygrophoropsis aurantiaca]
LALPSILTTWRADPALAPHILRISVSEPPSSCPHTVLPLSQASLFIHPYHAHEHEGDSDLGDDSTTADDNGMLAARVCELPSAEWDGLWDGLIYADNIKLRLLDYIHATLLLSDLRVDPHLVSANRLVLLHGPPGTGKTSLARALAHKLAIRLGARYAQARMLEVNAHSLFSRWFSESGKLVHRLFASIREIADQGALDGGGDGDGEVFVCVLIDEVESLTAARAGALAGTEPSDGLRVVNALLTQLDTLKTRRNVLVLATSNLVGAIDPAFIDRADLIQYVDLPPREAIYEILRGALGELVRRGCVRSIPSLAEALYYENARRFVVGGGQAGVESGEGTSKEALALGLLGLADRCRAQSLSGRALRRLPVLALARYISAGVRTGRRRDAGGTAGASPSYQTSVAEWLDAMGVVVAARGSEHARLG